MTIITSTQWRRLLFFSILAGVVGRVPDSQASSFYLSRPDEQPVADAEANVGWTVGVTSPEGFAAIDNEAMSTQPMEMDEVPIEISPVATQDQSNPSTTNTNDGTGGEEPDEECDDEEDLEDDEFDAQEDFDSEGPNEKPEMHFGPPDYLVNTDTDSSPSTTEYGITTTTTVQSSPTSYNPIVFWTVTGSEQSQASPVLELPFNVPFSDDAVEASPSDMGDTASESTQSPEEIVAMASPDGGSIIGISILGGLLAVMLIITVVILFWGYGWTCRGRHEVDLEEDYEDDKMSDARYTIPAHLKGKLEDDNDKWLVEWRRRKEELLNMREPDPVHVSNAVPMSPPLDLEHGRDSETFYNCPL